MASSDQPNRDNPPRSDRDDTSDQDVEKRMKEDLSSEARDELEERGSTDTNPRAEEPDEEHTGEERTGEFGHTYMGRTMDDALKGSNRRPRDEDELTDDEGDQETP